MGILESYQKIYKELQQLRPENPPTLIAVSKFQPIEKNQRSDWMWSRSFR